MEAVILDKTFCDFDIDCIVSDLEYEEQFYLHIADDKDYIVIPFCIIHGCTREDRLTNKIQIASASKENKKILYRLDYHSHTVVFCSKNHDKVAILPVDNPHGWEC